MDQDWVKEIPVAITITDTAGIIIEMNDKSAETFEKYGGKTLIGKKLMDIHPVKACAKIGEIIATKESNSYTIEKSGTKKLIYQTPWYKEGKYAGLVEISLEIPLDMPHFVRE